MIRLLVTHDPRPRPVVFLNDKPPRYHRGVDPRLAPDQLLTAYSEGMFPMDCDGQLLWFAPPRRAVIPLDSGFHVSGTLRQTIRQRRFDIRINTAFKAVMLHCADRSEGTWISADIVQAYCQLRALGFAHSVEAWKDNQLAGGLYGVALGGAFFGESMFHIERDASKVALVALVEHMRRRQYALLDTQFMTRHLLQFGTREITRAKYLHMLKAALPLKCVFQDG